MPGVGRCQSEVAPGLILLEEYPAHFSFEDAVNFHMPYIEEIELREESTEFGIEKDTALAGEAVWKIAAQGIFASEFGELPKRRGTRWGFDPRAVGAHSKHVVVAEDPEQVTGIRDKTGEFIITQQGPVRMSDLQNDPRSTRRPDHVVTVVPDEGDREW